MSTIYKLLHRVFPFVLFAGGIAGFIILPRLRHQPAREVPEPQAPLVETVAVEPHATAIEIAVDGVVVPYREVSLAAEVPGRVIHKAEACRAGKFVTKGTPLFEIDPRDYELEVRRLTEELSQADVMIKELEVEVSNTEALLELERESLSLSRKNLERLQELANSRVVTEAESDQSKRDELVAQNSVLTLSNQLQLLGTRRNRLERAKDLVAANLDKAKLDLERTKVVSPIDGVVVQEMVEQDAFVQKGASLLMIEDTSAVEVRSQLKMDDLFWLWRNSNQEQKDAASPANPLAPEQFSDYQVPRTTATIKYRLAGRDYQWQGELWRYDGIGLDEKTRTVPCRILVSDPRAVKVLDKDGQPVDPEGGPPALVRGMYVTVSLHTRPDESLLSLPETAVRPGSVVWQVRDGKLSIKQAHVARMFGDYVLVHAEGSQLSAGDHVVTSPLAVAEDGMPIREKTVE